MKFGIENLKLLLAFIFAFVKIGDKMGHENNWASRMSHLFGFLPALMTLGAIKWDQLDDEVKDIDDLEKAELVVWSKQKFDIIDDKLEVLIEDGLEFAAFIGGIVSKTKIFISKIKAYFKK